MAARVRITAGPSGHRIEALDEAGEPLDNAGEPRTSPYELMLMALGSCTAITIEKSAERMGLAINEIVILVSAGTINDPEGGGTIPHIVEEIHIDGDLSAEDLDKLEKIGRQCFVGRIFTGRKVLDSHIVR
jgi:putative redox protein